MNDLVLGHSFLKFDNQVFWQFISIPDRHLEENNNMAESIHKN